MKRINEIIKLLNEELETINKTPKNTQLLSSSDYPILIHKKESIKSAIKLLTDIKK